MLPSRGLARVGPGALSKNQIFATATFKKSTGTSRQFGTTLNSHARGLTPTSRLGFMSKSRVGAATLLSSPALSLASARRFASTGPELHSSSLANSTSSSELPDFSNLDSLDSLLNDVPEKVGYLSGLGLDYGWGPTSLCQWVLEHAHFTAGLGWGWSIIATGLVLRVAMFYPSLLAQRESNKMNELRKDPIYADLAKKMMTGLRAGGDARTATNDAAMIRMQMKMMEKPLDIKKRRLAFPMLQVPLAFGMFKLIRGMAALPVPGMDSQGFLWFSDLSMHDPYYILPCVSTIVLFITMKRTSSGLPAQSRGIMKLLPYILGPLTIICTIKMSAGVTLYFACTSIFQFIQTSIFLSPSTREMMGLPPISPSSGSPSASSPGSGQYQAPRTINVTAKESKDTKPESFMDIFNSVRDQVSGMMGEPGTKEGRKKRDISAQYDAKRRREEAEEYFARKEAAKRESPRGRGRKR